MNVRTTRHNRLGARRMLRSYVFAATLAMLGCTTGGLWPVFPSLGSLEAPLPVNAEGDLWPVFPSLGSRDVSEFQTFRFWLSSGLGFCPHDNAILSASIVKIAQGRYIRRMRVLVGEANASARRLAYFSETCPPADDLPPGAPPLQCKELPERELTQSEVDQMRERFREVVFLEGEDPLCDVWAIDWCVIRYFDWDGLEITNAALCGEYPQITDRMDEIGAFLEALR